MTGGRTPTERLTAISDGVFSVIITIMVLDLKPPVEANLSALLPLWPTALSYGSAICLLPSSGSIITAYCNLLTTQRRNLYGGISRICS